MNNTALEIMEPAKSAEISGYGVAAPMPEKRLEDLKKKAFEEEALKQSRIDTETHKHKDKRADLLKLSWNDNQIDQFLDNKPPDITGLCSNSGWTFPQGETSLLIAQGGTGKSYFLLGLMLAFAAGIGYSEFKPKKKYKVLGLFGEDSETILHARTMDIAKALSLDSKEHRYNMNKNFNALSVINMRLAEYGEHRNPILTENYKSLYDLLAEERDKERPIEVLIIDPLIRFYGLNENDNGEAAYFMDTVLGSLSKEFGITTILAHHVPKSVSKGFTALTISDIDQTSPRGASAFLDNSRYALAMMKVGIKEAKTYGIQEEDYKKFVAIKPIKNNYTAEVASPSFLRRFDRGVLLASNPQKDLNKIIEDELLSCLNDYYNGDEISCTTESRGKVKTDSETLPPKDERTNLTIRDLGKNDSKDPKIKRVVEIIHARLKAAGLKSVQGNIGLRLTALLGRPNSPIKIAASKYGKQEIVLV